MIASLAAGVKFLKFSLPWRPWMYYFREEGMGGGGACRVRAV